MSDGKQRNRKSGGGGGGNQRRRRGRTGQQQQQQHHGQQQAAVPRGPVMTSLGESTYEAVFDHGNEGYGVWFDGIVRDDPMYRQNWKGNRSIFVKIDQNQIVITRTLPGSDSGSDSSSEGASDSSSESRGSDRNGDDSPAPRERSRSRSRSRDTLEEGDSGDDQQVLSAEGLASEIAEDEAAKSKKSSDDDSSDDADEPTAEAETEPAPKRRTTRVRRKPVEIDDSGDSE